jgi:hypothetical protein
MRPFKSDLRCSILTTVCVATGIVLAVLSPTAPVLACRTATAQPTILLDAIPSAAGKSEVIAKVAILEVAYSDIPGHRSILMARALVMQSIRGTDDGQIIEINAEPSSCGGGLDPRSVGRTGFIAGRFYRVGDKTLFSGRW